MLFTSLAATPADRESGSPSFIDCAIGDYNAPEIAVEFSLKQSWSGEEVAYDFIKLIDPRNPFHVCFSHNLIVRNNRLASGGRLANLEARIEDALYEAIHRLDGDWCEPVDD